MDQHRETMAAARRGKNIHQLGLDQKDKLLAYAARLSEAHGEDAAIAFIKLCTEEQEAVSAHLENEIAIQNARTAARTNDIRAQQEKDAAFGAQFSPIIVTVIVLALMYSCFAT